jgi:hypothetical protein
MYTCALIPLPTAAAERVRDGNCVEDAVSDILHEQQQQQHNGVGPTDSAVPQAAAKHQKCCLGAAGVPVTEPLPASLRLLEELHWPSHTALCPPLQQLHERKFDPSFDEPQLLEYQVRVRQQT